MLMLHLDFLRHLDYVVVNFKVHQIIDTTKPSVRVGRKAYRVSRRQPGCRNITRYLAPAFFIVLFCEYDGNDRRMI
jgi:hypothetical protein